VTITSCNGFFVSERSIQSVTVTPTAAVLKVGDTPADTYTLSSSSTTVGGTVADDTATATWSSSNNSVVTVAAGVLTAGSTAGTATVTAKDGGATSNNCNVLTYTVPTPANLFVTSTITSGGIANPGTYQFHAYLGSTTSFPDVTQYVTWSSSDTTAATVNATTGLVTVLSLATPTSVTITATADAGASAPATQGTITGSLQFTAD
jgi:uncharacterized protein YjdB